MFYILLLFYFQGILSADSDNNLHFNSISKSPTTYAGFSVLVFVRKNSKMDGGKDMPPCSLDIQSSITMRLETYFVRHIPLPCRPQKRPQSCAQLFPLNAPLNSELVQISVSSPFFTFWPFGSPNRLRTSSFDIPIFSLE